MQVALVEGPPQPGEISAAEDRPQRADGEKEAGPGRNPACRLAHKRATGDDAVDGASARQFLASRSLPRLDPGEGAHDFQSCAHLSTLSRCCFSSRVSTKRVVENTFAVIPVIGAWSAMSVVARACNHRNRLAAPSART
jgi:hypothetical protein